VVLVAVVALATLLLIPHLAEVFMGLLAFIAENGATNMVGHGRRTGAGIRSSRHADRWRAREPHLFDILSLAWIAVALQALQRGIADWLAGQRGHVAASAAVLPIATASHFCSLPRGRSAGST